MGQPVDWMSKTSALRFRRRDTILSIFVYQDRFTQWSRPLVRNSPNRLTPRSDMLHGWHIQQTSLVSFCVASLFECPRALHRACTRLAPPTMDHNQTLPAKFVHMSKGSAPQFTSSAVLCRVRSSVMLTVGPRSLTATECRHAATLTSSHPTCILLHKTFHDR